MSLEEHEGLGAEEPQPARAAGGSVLARLRGRLRISRRGAIILAVVAVLVLGIVLPAVFAAGPGYLGRLPSLAAQYEPWAESTHLGAGCDGCHARPTILSHAAFRARLVGEFYLTLFSRTRVPAVFGRPSNDACLNCHSDLRTVSPIGDLMIPHRAHVSILEMECVECHSYVVHEMGPHGEHTPAMVDCLTCHDGETANDACWACHTEKAAPADHAEPEWLTIHGYHRDDPACDTCHKWQEGDWCADCHNRTPRSHGEDWRAVHRDRVAENRNCEVCHDEPFCVRCHGELPQLNYDPSVEPVR